MPNFRCTRCNGKGRRALLIEPENITSPWYRWEPCKLCNGTGRQQMRCDEALPAVSLIEAKMTTITIFPTSKIRVKVHV